MTHEVFEYFFDWDELEPFAVRSSLPGANGLPNHAVAADRRPSDVQQEKSGPSRDIIHAAATPSTQPLATSHAVPPDRTGEATTSTPPAETSGADVARPAPRNEGTLQRTPGEHTRVRRLLSVHALGQYVYCPRSAILAVETGDETEIDEPPPRLDYLPNFDLEIIEEALSQALRDLGLTVLLASGLVLMMAKGLWESSRGWFYPAFFVFIPVLIWLVQLVVVLVRLSLRRQEALRAEARAPDPMLNGVTPVNWWSMLKAGFEARRPQGAFRHPELPLEGSPWRVLQRGSLRIPVIRSGSRRLGPQADRVFPKHEIRLAAYGLLLEAAGHVRAPFGLVFPPDSARGLAVPLTETLKKDAVEMLAAFETCLTESQAGRSDPKPPPPPQRERCRKCPHGAPTALLPPEIERLGRAGTPLLVLESPEGRAFHCACGDRFGAAPPHEKSVRLKLHATVQ